MALKIDYSKRDIDSIVAEIQALVPKITDQWTNQLESDIGTALYKTFAAITDLNSFYLDRQSAEVYLESAELRESVVSISKMLGYSPRGASSASTKIKFISSISYNKDIVIPAGTKVFINRLPYMTVDEITIPAGYTDAEVDVVQGSSFRQVYYGNGVPWYRLSVPGNLTNIQVVIDGVTWTRVSSFIYTTEQTVYKVYPDIRNLQTIQFEAGLNTIVPPASAEIVVTGILSDGTEANLTTDNNDVVLIDRIYDIDAVPVEQFLTAFTVQAPSGAFDVESIDSIKYNAPRYFTTQNRVVADYDYAYIAGLVPGVRDAKCWGGEEVGRYGEVFVCVYGDDPENVPVSLLTNVENALIVRNMVPLLLNVIPPKIIKLDLMLDIYYSSASVIGVAKSKVASITSSVVNSLGIGSIFQSSDLVTELSKIPGVDYLKVTQKTVNIKGNIVAGRVSEQIIKYPIPTAIEIYVDGNLVWTPEYVVVNGTRVSATEYTIIEGKFKTDDLSGYPDGEIEIRTTSSYPDVYITREQFVKLGSLEIVNHITGSPRIVT